MALWPALRLESINKTVSVIIKRSQGYAKTHSHYKAPSRCLWTFIINRLIKASPLDNSVTVAKLRSRIR